MIVIAEQDSLLQAWSNAYQNALMFGLPEIDALACADMEMMK